jgi:hypothetical protein
MPLTPEEYEDVYLEAVRCLAERYSVSEILEEHQRRKCEIEGHLLGEEDVLRLWWGIAIANEILDR